MSFTLPQSFGWIGLGAMGYPMATQLCNRLTQSTELHIFDVDFSVLHRFAEENGDLACQVRIASNAKEVGMNSVRLLFLSVNWVLSDNR